MRYNTRVDITTNGDADSGILHLGHAAMLYLNSEIAHSSGGRFILRLDDAQKYWVNLCNMEANCEQVQKEVESLGIKADSVVHHSKMAPFINLLLSTHPKTGGMEEDRVDGIYPLPEVIGLPEVLYPYADYLIAEVVLLDIFSEINLVIVGRDLLPRFALYAKYCEMFGYEPIRQVFAPRLLQVNGDELSPVSKTVGNFKIKSFVDKGMTGAEIRKMVADVYLIEPAAPWSIGNVMAGPVIHA